MITAMEWRACVGFSAYEVSDSGDVRRLDTKRQMRPFISKAGYPTYSIERDDGERRNMRAHQLVARAFLGDPPSPSHIVAHNNGSKLLTHFSNLRWATREENESDKLVHGVSPQIGALNHNARITEAVVVEIRQRFCRIKAGLEKTKQRDLAAEFGITYSNLRNIIGGRRWAHLAENAA
jgi:hypothetical protein